MGLTPNDLNLLAKSKTLTIMAAGDWKDMLKGAQEGDLELVIYHIKMGVDPNYQHPEFLTTPLIESAQFGHLEITQYLLDNGADPNIKAGFSGDTALSVAKQFKQKAIVKLLKKHTKRKLGWFS